MFKRFFAVLLLTLTVNACALAPVLVPIGIQVAQELALAYIQRNPQPREVSTDDVATEIQQYANDNGIILEDLTEGDKEIFLKDFHEYRSNQ